MLHFPRWKAVFVGIVTLFGVFSLLPNLLTEAQRAHLPSFLPSSTVNLGLDLQGGAHMLLEVDMKAAVQMDLEKLIEDARAAVKGATVNQDGDGLIVIPASPRDADAAYAALKGLSSPISPGLGTPVQSLKIDRLENGAIRVALSEAGLKEKKISATNQVLEVVRRRIDELGTKEPTILREGEDRVLVQVPGLGNTDAIKAILQETAVLTFQMVDETANMQDVAAGKRLPLGTKLYPLQQGGVIPISMRPTGIRGDCLTNAQQSFDQNGLPAVSFRFDSNCAKKFGRITSRNIGKRFAIILDGKVISAPVIQSAILGGSGIINGNFTIEEANKLAILLRAGALPAPIKIVEERTVGPDLGTDSITSGKKAAVISVAAVCVYMILAYGFFGLIANIGLIVNLALIIGTMSALQATLTLPGIAGLVLTIGMSVDANVLIYERAREELRHGRPALPAIAAGYDHAFITILDANITALITTLFLFQFGTGPVKGFAVVLSIGIIWSVFSATLLTRYLLTLWLNWRRPKLVVV